MADHGFATTFATAASDQLLQLEHDHGHGDRFDAIDALTANLLAAALSGNKLVDIQPGVRGTKNTDILTIGPLTSGERALVDQTFTLATQQARGAWFLPEQATLKAATLNLPSYLRHHPWHAITLAFDDVARVKMASAPDALAAWALLIPLFDTLLAPVLKRAEGSTDPADKQHETWAAILDSYQRLGIHAGPAIAMFTYRGGWSRLDRAGQAQARAAVLDALAGCDLRQIAARFRTMRVQALTAATAKKASRGTPLARQLLTKKLQPVLAAYFGGEWLAFLSYLGMPPNPNEEVVSALPEPRLYVSGSTKAAAVAAEHGLDVDDVHAMLAAFMGQTNSTSPVERRVDVLNRWWAEFDALHARQTTGLPSLWGLVEPGTLDVSRGFGRATPLYRQMMTPNLVADIDQLWDGIVLPRWPETIVSEPFPHRLMAETFGAAVSFWEGVALTAWYVCEGPYSRTSLPGLRKYHERDLAALEEIGTPIHHSLFDELEQAEHHLGPPEDTDAQAHPLELPGGKISIRFSGGGRRRAGFEMLRDIITRHRQGWARRYLADYLRHRWTHEISTVAREVNRVIAEKGKPPTYKQYARFAASAANHWFNGDLAGLYTAIGEKAPKTPRRVDMLPAASHEFVNAVYIALGGEYYDEYELRVTDFPAADRFRQISRLASGSLYYLQVAEALGRPPQPTEFGANRYEWEWAGDIDKGWPIYQHAIEQTRIIT